MQRLFFTVLFFTLASFQTFAQNQNSMCEMPLEYKEDSSADQKTISLRRIKGIVNLNIGKTGESTDVATVTDLCLGLFTEDTHKLVATIATGNGKEAGVFSFPKVKRGRYRLITFLGSQSKFDFANIPVKVVGFPQGGFFKKRELYLHMRFAVNGSQSYATTKTAEMQIAP
jgi:hypothetical protein